MAEERRRHDREPTSRCSRSRPTRSTPRCRAPDRRLARDPRPGGRDGRRRNGAGSDRRRRGAAPPPASRRRYRPPDGRDRAGAGSRPTAEPAQPDPRRPPPSRPLPSGAPSGSGRKRPRAGSHTFVSPVVARIAAEHGIDPSTARGHRPRRPGHEEGHPGLCRVGGPAEAGEPATAATPFKDRRRLRLTPPATGSATSADRPRSRAVSSRFAARLSSPARQSSP